MDMIQSIRAFTEVASAGSFTRAARRLKLGASSVTRAVADIESHLGMRLLDRTTRTVALTDAGRWYLVHCHSILSLVDLVDAGAADRRATPSGVLRLGVDPTLDRHHFASLVAAYGARYPEVVIELALAPGAQPDWSGRHDAVLTGGAVRREAGLVFERLGAVSSVLCAAPAYVASHGLPQSVGDLSGHRCLALASGSALRAEWSFHGPAGPETFAFGPSLLVTDMADMLVEAVLDGAGIGPVPVVHALQALRGGRLVSVLPAYQLAGTLVELVYPLARFADPKIYTWALFLRAELPGRLAVEQAALLAFIDGLNVFSEIAG